MHNSQVTISPNYSDGRCKQNASLFVSRIDISTHALCHLPRLRIQSDNLRGHCKHRAAAGRDSVLRTALLVEATKAHPENSPIGAKANQKFVLSTAEAHARMLSYGACGQSADSPTACITSYENLAVFVNAFMTLLSLEAS